MAWEIRSLSIPSWVFRVCKENRVPLPWPLPWFAGNDRKIDPVFEIQRPNAAGHGAIRLRDLARAIKGMRPTCYYCRRKLDLVYHRRGELQEITVLETSGDPWFVRWVDAWVCDVCQRKRHHNEEESTWRRIRESRTLVEWVTETAVANRTALLLKHLRRELRGKRNPAALRSLRREFKRLTTLRS